MTAPFGTDEYAANLALGHLGQPEIASMAETTTRARKIRQFFPLARDATLRLKDWNFATAWIQPAADPVAGLGDLTIRYPLDDDCLKVRFIKGDNRRPWAIEGGTADVGGVGVEVEAMVLVTNIVAPTICITRRVTAMRLWDPLALEGFGYVLASYCATSLGKSASWADDMMKKAEAKVSTAATIDSRENNSDPQCRPETSWEAARRGRRGGYRGGGFLSS